MVTTASAARHDLLQHRLLAGRWAGPSTVCSTTMLGTVSRRSSGSDVRAVGAGVDAVLVLDDGDVEGVERVAPRPASRRRRGADQVCTTPGRRALAVVAAGR